MGIQAANHRKKRLAARPHALSIEAVLDLADRLDAVAPEHPAVRELTTAVRQWCQERRNRIISENVGLVGKAVNRRYRHALESLGIPLADAMQEGCMIVGHAADLYDEERGIAFSTYASRWIFQTISRLLQRDRTIANPADRKRRERSVETYCCSLDGTEEGFAVLSQVVGSDDRAIRHADARMQVEELMGCLLPRQRELIRLRFIEGLTLEEASVRLRAEQGGRLTRERVRQIEAQAMARLKERAEWLRRWAAKQRKGTGVGR